MTSTLYAVLPGGIDDPAAPSGGNTYDRRVLAGLSAQREVREILASGSWPVPDDKDVERLAGALRALPDGATVLLDGLVACAAPGVMEAQRGRLHLVVLVHLPLGDEPGADPALTIGERRALESATTVVATSEGAAQRIEQLHDLPRVFVAPPGVDGAGVAEMSETGNRLLCVAAVTLRKAQDVLVEALSLVDDLPWQLRCVGSLDQDRHYVTRVRSVSDRVEFPGPLTGAALDAAYASADLLVLPSRAETYGMVVTEALARGVPVLGTRVAGVPEALGSAPDGRVPGALLPPGDVPALAGALRRWLTDPGLRAGWRSAALARRGTLRGWDETTRRLSEVLP
ncbi:glycosyltransferase family 4 protein [Symbioplanes lichenis]|uniref:glycosyltransferase family 4 protein n=1 Tax=Symbioplanes lichenis TaxID=1629072 RepID=UPI002738ABB6|nr:glycosyltransferase family 4 protein [Actinoplanes lichenis]